MAVEQGERVADVLLVQLGDLQFCDEELRERERVGLELEALATGTSCDIEKPPTKTSTWRSFPSSKNSRRSVPCSALKAACGS